MGMSMGAAVLTAQYYGAGNNPSLKKIVTIVLRMGLVMAAAFTVATLYPWAVCAGQGSHRKRRALFT